MGETGPVDNHIENPVKKGCNPAEAGIREHIQGGPQPGRPIYFAPHSNRAMKNLCLGCYWYNYLGGGMPEAGMGMVQDHQIKIDYE